MMLIIITDFFSYLGMKGHALFDNELNYHDHLMNYYETGSIIGMWNPSIRNDLLDGYQLLSNYQSANIVRMWHTKMRARFKLQEFLVKSTIADAIILFLCTKFPNIVVTVEYDRRCYDGNFCRILFHQVEFVFNPASPFANVLCKDSFSDVVSNTTSSSSCYLSKSLFDRFFAEGGGTSDQAGRGRVVGTSLAFHLHDIDKHVFRTLRWHLHLREFFLLLWDFKKKKHYEHPLDNKDLKFEICSFL